MSHVTQVYIDKKVLKTLDKLPSFILKKFNGWVFAVENYSILNVRQIKGFHDEPLKGKRNGQRSVRLNSAYRVIYVENLLKEIVILNVIEVNKHEY